MADNRILLHNATYVITMDGERRIIKDGSILVENDRIAAVDKTIDTSQLEINKVINAKDMVVTPGFINGHCHISYAHATRGIFPDDLGNDYLVNVFRLQDSMSHSEATTWPNEPRRSASSNLPSRVPAGNRPVQRTCHPTPVRKGFRCRRAVPSRLGSLQWVPSSVHYPYCLSC